MFADADFINKLANHFGAITGIKKAYSFAENPDNLTPAQLPCVMFYPQQFTHEPLAHHNRWKTEQTIRAVLFVTPREMSGGRLKFLENTAIPFGNLVRTKFEQESVLVDLLSVGPSGGTTRAWLTRGMYGAGMPELMHNGIPYIGWVFDYTITNAT